MSEGLSWEALTSIATIVGVGVTILAGVIGLLIRLGINPLRSEIGSVKDGLDEIKVTLARYLEWRGDHDHVHRQITTRIDQHDRLLGEHEQRIGGLEVEVD